MDDQEYIHQHYVMNPEQEHILFDGTELFDGARVVVEDPTVRGPDSIHSPMDAHRRDKWNRWVTVSRLTITEHGIAFIGTFADGTQQKFEADLSTAWICDKRVH